MTTSAHATVFDPIAEIAGHSEGLARAAEPNLAAPVEHCPGWTVADLVWHLTGVHWFWAKMVAELLPEPPPDALRPDRPPAEQLVGRFRAGAEHLVRVLAEADPAAACWTWASQRDAGFVRRHQVQEAAVHHWDAEHAAGRDISLGTAMSADAVEEFLTFSVATVAGHSPDPPRPALGGTLVLAATDAGTEWTVTDDRVPGTVRFSAGPTRSEPAGSTRSEPAGSARSEPAGSARSELAGSARVSGTASDLLLWLYGRVPLPVTAVPTAGPTDSPTDSSTAGPARQRAADELVARFRALAFTD